MDGPTDKSSGLRINPADCGLRTTDKNPPDCGLRTLDLSLALHYGCKEYCEGELTAREARKEKKLHPGRKMYGLPGDCWIGIRKGLRMTNHWLAYGHWD